MSRKNSAMMNAIIVNGIAYKNTSANDCAKAFKTVWSAAGGRLARLSSVWLLTAEPILPALGKLLR